MVLMILFLVIGFVLLVKVRICLLTVRVICRQVENSGIYIMDLTR